MLSGCSAARNFACQTQLADAYQSKCLPETSQSLTDSQSRPSFNVSPLVSELSTHNFIHCNFEKRERSPRKLSDFTDILETAEPNGIGESTGTSKLHHRDHIPLSVQTSDCGWGCMIRSGQMLLAQALTTHILGRNWRLFRRKKLIATAEDCVHRNLIRWFHDCWSPAAPFSLHRLVRLSGQQPGTWFGPGSMCAAIVKAMASAMEQFDLLSQIHVYYARDRVIYRREIMELARGHPVTRKLNQFHFTDHTGNYASGSNMNQPDILPDVLTTTGKLKDSSSSAVQCSTQNAIILLIPLMLGTSKHIDRSFITMICGLFADPCCIGLIGGRPKHSVYVAGSVARELVYLDPHYTQPVVSDISRVDFCVKSWHCTVPKTMDAAKLDPSCAVGFYCRSRCELSDLLERLPQLLQARSVCAKSLIEIVDEEVDEAV
ncbi:hypothetical protein EG68_04732 [Paragonimus skrjabini miyazakii]|uniref:Cysteine protease n=1 Tax=Paragonimus skrjabini miyazakii TaxID=59628 RepID=A0A8S9YSY7_9TREM|nr:hypothetical protein EG68_04732 [Paragonimus skrjabini miyazakii]